MTQEQKAGLTVEVFLAISTAVEKEVPEQENKKKRDLKNHLVKSIPANQSQRVDYELHIENNFYNFGHTILVATKLNLRKV